MTRVIERELGVADVQVQAHEGGRKGLRISVTLPEAARLSVPLVEQALAAYLFETQVAVG